MYRLAMKELRIQVMTKKLGHGEKRVVRQRQELVQAFESEGINQLMSKGWRMCARFEGQQVLQDLSREYGTDTFYNQLQNESLEQLLVSPPITAG